MAFVPKPVAGSALYRKTGASTYAVIEGLEGFTVTGGEREETTVRPMNATSPITITGAMSGLKGQGKLYYNPSDTVHSALAASFNNNTEETFKMVLSDATTYYFKGYVASQLDFHNLEPSAAIAYNFVVAISSAKSATEL